MVAAIALYATVTAGFQGALMVPTEILAQQHMESLQQLFDPNEVTVALLTGSTKTKNDVNSLKTRTRRNQRRDRYTCIDPRWS